MQPGQLEPLPPQVPLPSDFLNEIATPQPQPKSHNFLFFGLIALAAVLVIFFIFALFSGGSGAKSISSERLGLRLQTLQKISQDAHKNIKSSDLRSINSNLTIYLVNANRDITTPLENAEINLKKADKKIIAEENGEKLTASLEDARLNATYDTTYAREMAYELERLGVMMQSLNKTSRSVSLKTFLEKSYKDLSALRKQFAEYTSASS